jgi:hypothetical protein
MTAGPVISASFFGTTSSAAALRPTPGRRPFFRSTDMTIAGASMMRGFCFRGGRL